MEMEKRMFIGGALCGEPNFDVISPATERPVARVAFGDGGDARRALAAAEDAFPAWAATPPSKRADWMRRLRAEIVAREEHLRLCVHLETGKPWSATAEDFQSLIDSLAFYGEAVERFAPQELPDKSGSHRHTLEWTPVGVAVAFLAWNFPLLNLAFKIGPAMAAGCPLVVKPSFKSPLSACAVGEICAAIELPPGVFNVVCGADEEVGDALSGSTTPALLTLIGSARTGRRIIEKGATSIKRFSMELGGNAPALIFADADLDAAADIVAALKFNNSGQICVTPNRVFAHAEIADSLAAKIVAKAKARRLGFDRADGGIDMGPLIDRAAWERVDGIVQDAVAGGARLLCGGRRPARFERGHYYEPTALDGVTPRMRASREEIFGPVVALARFEEERDALALANDTDAGLTAYLFTRDEARQRRLADALRFGEIQINGVKYGIDLPHGGFKQSGVGVDCSELALRDYLAPKRISRALGA